MSRRIILRNPTFSSDDNTEEIVPSSGRRTAKFMACCGETTAGCAAVVCCFPIGIANLLVLTVYKVPARLCRLALRRKRRRKLLKKALLQQRHHHRGGLDVMNEPQIRPIVYMKDFFNDVEFAKETDKAVEDLEKEMWKRFNESGFWRTLD